MKEKDIFEDLRIVIVVGLFSALKRFLNCLSAAEYEKIWED